MTTAEHRLEAERLHREANELQRSEDATRRLYCMTMAHAKRLQARWHERRIPPDLEILSRPIVFGSLRAFEPMQLRDDGQRIYALVDHPFPGEKS